MISRRDLVRGALAAAALLPASSAAQSPKKVKREPDFNDAHFHLTNYVQEGPSIEHQLAIMADRVGRSTLFGIPLQQTWSYENTGDVAPTYYLDSDAPLYYYSFTDAVIASLWLALRPEDRARFDPMITGFNPADMYGADHIRRVLHTFPGVFTGIGEFTVHKEFVSSKVAGDTASLTDPALDRIFALAAEAGLLVLIHNDIDVPFAKTGAAPKYLDDAKALFARHPDATIVWAHTGLGRVVRPPVQGTEEADERPPTHLEILKGILNDAQLAHVSFDISWSELAKYAIGSADVEKRTADLFNRYPDRFLFGTDTVGPADASAYYGVYDLWAPVWSQLTPDASRKIRLDNYTRVFDAARQRVRAWEKANVPPGSSPFAASL